MGNEENKGYRISVPSVEESGCKVIVTFSAICFKRNFNLT